MHESRGKFLFLVILVICLQAAPAQGAAGVFDKVKDKFGNIRDHIRDVLNNIRDQRNDNLVDDDVRERPKPNVNVSDVIKQEKEDHDDVMRNNSNISAGSDDAISQNDITTNGDDATPDDSDDDGLSSTDLKDDRQTSRLFDRWQRRHKKSFRNLVDRNSSLSRLRDTAERIKKFNARKNITYRMGLNEFSDWSFDEVKRKLLGYIALKDDELLSLDSSSSNNSSNSSETDRSKRRRRQYLTYKDWGAEGYVASVKNQGSCASCWAITATAALEAAYRKRYGSLPNLSPQEFVECVWPYIGCGGGQTYEAIKYANRWHGIASLSSYPYISQSGSYQSCRRDSTVKISIGGVISYTMLTANSDSALMDALTNHGPVATAVSVANGFQNYRSGILDKSACGTDINHAVLVTGYGVDSATGIKYWKVKNSWGSTWGENGYVRINRDQLNTCGLTKQALKVTIS